MPAPPLLLVLLPGWRCAPPSNFESNQVHSPAVLGAMEVIGPNPVAVRDGVDITSNKVARLSGGTRVQVLDEQILGDGTVRVRVGERHWISAITSARKPLLQPISKSAKYGTHLHSTQRAVADYYQHGLHLQSAVGAQGGSQSHTRVIWLSPSHAGAYTHIGSALHSAHHSQRASRKHYEQALSAHSRLCMAYHQYGTVNSELRQLSTSIPSFIRIVALEPSQPIAYHSLALDTERSGQDLSSSLGLFAQAIALRHRAPAEIYGSAGNALQSGGHHDEVHRPFTRRANSMSQLGQSYNNQGVVQGEQRDSGALQRQLLSYTRASRMQPRDGGAYNNFALSLEVPARSEAIRRFIQASTIVSTHAKAYLNLAALTEPVVSHARVLHSGNLLFLARSPTEHSVWGKLSLGGTKRSLAGLLMWPGWPAAIRQLHLPSFVLPADLGQWQQHACPEAEHHKRGHCASQWVLKHPSLNHGKGIQPLQPHLLPALSRSSFAGYVLQRKVSSPAVSCHGRSFTVRVWTLLVFSGSHLAHPAVHILVSREGSVKLAVTAAASGGHGSQVLITNAEVNDYVPGYCIHLHWDLQHLHQHISGCAPWLQPQLRVALHRHLRLLLVATFMGALQMHQQEVLPGGTVTDYPTVIQNNVTGNARFSNHVHSFAVDWIFSRSDSGGELQPHIIEFQGDPMMGKPQCHHQSPINQVAQHATLYAAKLMAFVHSLSPALASGP